MARENVSAALETKLKKFFEFTHDKNGDGVINWEDFKSTIDSILSVDEYKKSGKLTIFRDILEKDYQKYFADLCKVADSNHDGNIDLDEWIDMMNGIIGDLKQTNKFPEWYEGLHHAVWRCSEFSNHSSISKSEFAGMVSIWCIDAQHADAAYDCITDNGKKSMDYNLFSELMKQFFLNSDASSPLNLGF